MKPKVIVALLAVLSFAARAGLAQGPSLAELPVIDTSSAEAPKEWIARGHELYAASRYRESIAAFERALQLRVDGSADGAWNVARAYAQLGNQKQALRWLTHARQMGFRNEEAIRNEPAFDKFRDDARFREIVMPSACMGCQRVLVWQLLLGQSTENCFGTRTQTELDGLDGNCMGASRPPLRPFSLRPNSVCCPRINQGPLTAPSLFLGVLLRVERSFNTLAACRPRPENASSSLPCSYLPKRDTTPRA